MKRSQAVRNCINAFHKFLDDCDYWETIETEQTIHTDLWAGTRDWKVSLKWNDIEGIYTIDFKCSSGIYTTNRIQVAAYSSIDESKPGLLRLDKETGEYEFKCEGQRGWSAKKTRQYINKFNAYVALYYLLQGA